MQLLGQTLESNFVENFTLSRPDGNTLIFKLSPLPLGFQRKIRKRGITPPSPPLKVARNSAGKPLRDESGLAVTHTDSSDANYREEVETFHQRVAVMAIVEALRNDPSISFDAVLPTSETENNLSWCRYADSIFEELEQAGLTAGDLIAFCDRICQMSNMLDRHLQESHTNFSAPPIDSST